MIIQPVDCFDRRIGTCSDRGSRPIYFSAAGFSSAFPAGLAPPFGAGDLLPYHDEYSNELRNSFFSPQVLQLPWLTAPFGGSITQWWTQSLSLACALASGVVVSSAAAALFFVDEDGLI